MKFNGFFLFLVVETENFYKFVQIKLEVTSLYNHDTKISIRKLTMVSRHLPLFRGTTF